MKIRLRHQLTLVIACIVRGWDWCVPKWVKIWIGEREKHCFFQAVIFPWYASPTLHMTKINSDRTDSCIFFKCDNWLASCFLSNSKVCCVNQSRQTLLNSMIKVSTIYLCPRAPNTTIVDTREDGLSSNQYFDSHRKRSWKHSVKEY